MACEEAEVAQRSRRNAAEEADAAVAVVAVAAAAAVEAGPGLGFGFGSGCAVGFSESAWWLLRLDSFSGERSSCSEVCCLSSTSSDDSGTKF